ncbi:MAG: ATP-dependent DNA helicase DinG [Gammaproteobacteria bacterium]|nr:MAG: ATP-dependent DNA helicase DinG [Gammaproteobacteria bacterium]
MLTDALKDEISSAYKTLLKQRSLKPRWGQRLMIADVAKALARVDSEAEGSAIAVVEAGTGTGKTIAYTVAALPIARAKEKKLVVATATVALQEQFFGKDLPDILAHSDLDFSYALAKGRRRYLCLSKLDQQLAAGKNSELPFYDQLGQSGSEPDADAVFQDMLNALGRGEWDGDRDAWPAALSDEFWQGITTDHNQCSGRRCPNISQCSFFKARDGLNLADVIVTNHDLVLADLALGGGAVLPPPQDTIYIFDEGHHLPSKALSHFSGFCRLHSTVQWLQDCQTTLSQTAKSLDKLPGLQGELSQPPQYIEAAIDDLQNAQVLVQELMSDPAVKEVRDGRQLRFELGLIPDELQIIGKALLSHFSHLELGFDAVHKLLEKALEEKHSERDLIEQHAMNYGAMLARAQANVALWSQYAVSGEDDTQVMARWITEREWDNALSYDLNASPVIAANILQQCLWQEAAGVVMTSATLSALGTFARFIRDSGVPEDAIFDIVPSPFDYASAVFSVPPMPCEPTDAEAHTAAIIDLLPKILDPAQGSLVLFSSRRQMRDVFAGVDGKLGEHVYVQDSNSKQELLRLHKKAIDDGSGSVIFGLASFAEGVDLPGNYCTHVVIAKLPFAVPDSPLEAALVEWVENGGGNAFMEVSVPEAAVRLVQAAGRLLRTETDTGRVTLLDRRVVTRRYGKAILQSLPPFTLELAR